eukprot:561514-Pleurochrysis_carterae.AAC.2
MLATFLGAAAPPARLCRRWPQSAVLEPRCPPQTRQPCPSPSLTQPQSSSALNNASYLHGQAASGRPVGVEMIES